MLGCDAWSDAPHRAVTGWSTSSTLHMCLVPRRSSSHVMRGVTAAVGTLQCAAARSSENRTRPCQTCACCACETLGAHLAASHVVCCLCDSIHGQSWKARAARLTAQLGLSWRMPADRRHSYLQVCTVTSVSTTRNSRQLPSQPANPARYRPEIA